LNELLVTEDLEVSDWP